MSFVVSALPAAPFQPLFALSDAQLAARGIIRRTVEGPGSPCRVTLADAEPGETVLLLNYEHQPADTPSARDMRSSFVKARATRVSHPARSRPPSARVSSSRCEPSTRRA